MYIGARAFFHNYAQSMNMCPCAYCCFFTLELGSASDDQRKINEKNYLVQIMDLFVIIKLTRRVLSGPFTILLLMNIQIIRSALSLLMKVFE